MSNIANPIAAETPIWRVTPGLSALTTHAYYDVSPWSRDGTRIAWSAWTTGSPDDTADVYVTDVSAGASVNTAVLTAYDADQIGSRYSEIRIPGW